MSSLSFNQHKKIRFSWAVDLDATGGYIGATSHGRASDPHLWWIEAGGCRPSYGFKPSQVDEEH